MKIATMLKYMYAEGNDDLLVRIAACVLCFQSDYSPFDFYKSSGKKS